MWLNTLFLRRVNSLITPTFGYFCVSPDIILRFLFSDLDNLIKSPINSIPI